MRIEQRDLHARDSSVRLHAPEHVDELVEDLDGPLFATEHRRSEPDEQGSISHNDSFLSLTIRTSQNSPLYASPERVPQASTSTTLVLATRLCVTTRSAPDASARSAYAGARKCSISRAHSGCMVTVMWPRRSKT